MERDTLLRRVYFRSLSMETMMQVSILGRRSIPAGSGTVPTVAMDLHFRENGWTHTETISVTSDAPNDDGELTLGQAVMILAVLAGTVAVMLLAAAYLG